MACDRGHTSVETVAAAVQPLAAASVPAVPDRAVGAEADTAAVSVNQVPPPDTSPAAAGFSLKAPPAFPAEQAHCLYDLPAGYSVCEPHCYAACSDSARCAVFAAVPDVDSDLRNTGVGMQEAVRVTEQLCGPTCPILFDAVPTHAPNADPSGAVHSAATRGSMPEDAGSSAREHAGCTPALLPAAQNPTGH